MNDEEKRKAEDASPESDASDRPNVEGNGAGALDASVLVDRLQRLQAEFENYKKRVAREIAEREERAGDGLLLDVLPLFDALQLAFESQHREADADAFISGVERIFAQFGEILKSKGVTRIDAIGTPFDPAMHEALLSLPSDEERNVIVEEFSPGYARGGRTLRPSKVGVSQGPAKEEEE